MTDHIVAEGTNMSVYSELETNNKIKIGDTIHFISNNQMGEKIYKVILNENNMKDLRIIDSYDHKIGDCDYNSEDDYLRERVKLKKCSK